MRFVGQSEKLEADVLLGCTGAAQLLAIGDYIAAIKDITAGRLGIVLTPTAARFGPVPLLEAVADEVIVEITTANNHISLSRKYQQFVVVPATANYIAGAALGLARNSVELLTLAMERPTVVVPAMNETMWVKAATQRNVSALEGDGHIVLRPTKSSSVYEAASRSLRFALGAAGPIEVASAVYTAITGD
ncbi:flavoprotein [Actinomyces ruminis]|uniref:Flavoprotein domain-containing protein n=1 Tax=Actinomyces ruminis TaxID=1937003 RepID=A0ABX4MBM9_9ACTO|nr:flavoprotein [Actinomyces ruminis]PHP52548.1 hypothetical protein BW737_008660 [Actinomyces ruminis]